MAIEGGDNWNGDELWTFDRRDFSKSTFTMKRRLIMTKIWDFLFQI